jgi:NAD-dependent SIR2 family protein deacetylase
MPVNNVKEAKQILENCDALLVVAGAGMSVDSGIFTYRGTNGIWNKTITIGNNNYGYDEISSLTMWKTNPKIAWGFKANFYNIMSHSSPHEGYYNLLKFVSNKLQNNYFICTSNIDNYFEKAGFDKDKIYEVHGTMKLLQCMDKSCSVRNGTIEMTKDYLPNFDEKTFIASKLPKCPNCKNILRPNVSMFGDYDFYGQPYAYARKKMENWIQQVGKNKQNLVVLEIGCGINPHSLRMNNGVMISKEWKLPKIINVIKSIRLNPDDVQEEENTIHVSLGAKKGLSVLL